MNLNYYTDVLKKYAVFSGRAGRQEYWMFFLYNLIFAIVAFILDKTISIGYFGALYGFAVFIPSLAVSVRRLHDTGRSGWWLLIDFVPFVGGIILIVFLVLDSQPGDNQYGPNPKGM